MGSCRSPKGGKREVEISCSRLQKWRRNDLCYLTEGALIYLSRTVGSSGRQRRYPVRRKGSHVGEKQPGKFSLRR